jgi:peptidyl-prolyl cis-trans isomerase A (cyclophilin A)
VIRTFLFVVLGLGGLAGCPKATPAHHQPADLYLSGPPAAPKICVPAFPESDPMEASQRVSYEAGKMALTDRNPRAAVAALSRAGEHPAVQAAMAVAALLEGETQVAVDLHAELLEAYPEDPCLLQAAAISARQADDQALALERGERAWALAPEDANAGLLYAILLTGSDLVAAEMQVQALLEHHPEKVGGHLLQALFHLERGEVEAAIPFLQRAYSGGVPAAELLLAAYRETGRLGETLRLNADLGAPLGDDGAISGAEDPVAAYYAVLGMEPGQELVAVIATSAGELRCRLFPEEAPVAVANFVGLSRGTILWTDPETGAVREDPLYTGTVFHRVIPGFMVQAGDPAGSGSGGPGYRFLDEISSTRSFDQSGVLAMANAGPNTNGSQWFITEAPTPHLDGRHTIFGQCDQASVEVVKAIARVPTNAEDRPDEDVVIDTVRLEVHQP